MAALTAKPAARRAAALMSHMRPLMRLRTLPSLCSTRRTCSARALGDGLADLVGDGVGVGTAVPDLALRGGEGVGIFAGEGVFGLGAGGDFDTAHRVGSSGDLLSGVKRQKELIISVVAGGDDAGDAKSVSGDRIVCGGLDDGPLP